MNESGTAERIRPHQPSALHGIRRLSHAAATLALSVCAAPAFAAPDWDMVGVKLGMTEAEVTAAFLAYDAKGKIIKNNASFSYSDKVNSFRTPPFLTSMQIQVLRRSIQTPLKVWFSGPAGDVRVIAIARQELDIPNPPTGEQFMQSLVAKYGKPTALNSANVPTWEEKGKPSCIWVSSGANAANWLDFNPFSKVINPPGQADFSEAASDLEQRQADKLRGKALPADLSTCGAFMYYTGTNFNPANHFVGGLFDVGAIMATHRSRKAWVDQLQAEAIRKRESQGQAPRL